MNVIPVDLTKTGGKLLLPGAPTAAQAPMAQPRAASQPAAATPPAASKSANDNVEAAAPPASKYRYPEPVADDFQAFLQALVEGRRYTKTETLFGGVVSVTFRTTSAAEEAAMAARAIGEMRATGGMTVINSIELTEKQMTWQFGMSVASMRIGKVGYQAPPPEDNGAIDYDARHQEIQRRCGEGAVYVAVRAAYVRFSNLIGGLEERAADPNFFGAIGSGGRS